MGRSSFILNAKLIVIIVGVFVALNFIFKKIIYYDSNDAVATLVILIGVNLGRMRFISKIFNSFKKK